MLDKDVIAITGGIYPIRPYTPNVIKLYFRTNISRKIRNGN